MWVLTIKLSPSWNAMLRLRNKMLLSLEHSRMKPKGKSLKEQRHTGAQLRRGTQVQRPSEALWCSRGPCIIFRKEWASRLYWQHRLHNLGRSDSGGLGVVGVRFSLWAPRGHQGCYSLDRTLGSKILNQMWKNEMNIACCGKEWGYVCKEM